MPDITLNKLTDVKCRKAGQGRHSDGGGLYLNVKPTGAKNWLFVYRWGDKRPSIGFGGYPAVGLADARKYAAQCRDWLNETPRKDPKKAWKALSAPEAPQETFGPFALKHIEAIKSDFRNAKHVAQWRSTLETYAAPLWQMPLDEVGVEDVLSCLEPIWGSKNETARRVRGRIEAVLESARVRGLRNDPNPASWNGQLKHVLGKKRPAAKHFAALEYASMPEFWKTLSEKQSMGSLALRFLILTAARSGEVRLATWSEMDLEKGVWTIPADRMKASREHIVPLSRAAMAILKHLDQARTGDIVFPGARRGTSLSDMTLTKALRDMKAVNTKGEPITVHGFRSTFSDWARNETDFPRELIEESLAHSLGKVEAAYRRGAAIERRRELMEAWQQHLQEGRGAEAETACAS
jgi:integrase